MASLMDGLIALDKVIRDATTPTGAEGSGLYMLLDNLAVSSLGIPRSSFPVDPPPPDDAKREPGTLPGDPAPFVPYEQR